MFQKKLLYTAPSIIVLILTFVAAVPASGSIKGGGIGFDLGYGKEGYLSQDLKGLVKFGGGWSVSGKAAHIKSATDSDSYRLSAGPGYKVSEALSLGAIIAYGFEPGDVRSLSISPSMDMEIGSLWLAEYMTTLSFGYGWTRYMRAEDVTAASPGSSGRRKLARTRAVAAAASAISVTQHAFSFGLDQELPYDFAMYAEAALYGYGGTDLATLEGTLLARSNTLTDFASIVSGLPRNSFGAGLGCSTIKHWDFEIYSTITTAAADGSHTTSAGAGAAWEFYDQWKASVDLSVSFAGSTSPLVVSGMSHTF